MKRLFFLLTVITFSFVLSACLSPEQIRANQLRAQQEAQYRQQQAMESIRSKCDGFGFQRGTAPFAQCVQREVNRGESCTSSKKAIEDRINNCQNQCWQSLNTMQCRNNCELRFGSIPNC
jgi:hypothetical protein